MEYEGQRIDTSNYQLKKMRALLQVRDSEIKSLKTRLEQVQTDSKEKIEQLQKSVAFFKKRYSGAVKSREKPVVETTEKSQGVRESVAMPESPPISQEE